MGVLDMYFERIIDIQTGKETIREFTPDEIAQLEASRVITEAERAAKQAEAETKAAARQAILDRLGLTADEAKLLLG